MTHDEAQPMRGFSHRPAPGRMSQSMRQWCEVILADCVDGGEGRKMRTWRWWSSSGKPSGRPSHFALERLTGHAVYHASLHDRAQRTLDDGRVFGDGPDGRHHHGRRCCARVADRRQQRWQTKTEGEHEGGRREKVIDSLSSSAIILTFPDNSRGRPIPRALVASDGVPHGAQIRDEAPAIVQSRALLQLQSRRRTHAVSMQRRT